MLEAMKKEFEIGGENDMLDAKTSEGSQNDGEIFDAAIDVDLDYNDVTQTIEALAYSSFLRMHGRQGHVGREEGDPVDYSLFSPEDDSLYYFMRRIGSSSGGGDNEKESGEDDNHNRHLFLPDEEDEDDNSCTDAEGSEEDEADLEGRLGKTMPRSQVVCNGLENAPATDDSTGEMSCLEQKERSLFSGDEWRIADSNEDEDEDMTEPSYLMIIEEQRRALQFLMQELAEQKGHVPPAQHTSGAEEDSSSVIKQKREEAALAARSQDYALLLHENKRLRRENKKLRRENERMLGNPNELGSMSLLELKALERRMKTSYDFIYDNLLRRMEGQMKKAGLAALKAASADCAMCRSERVESVCLPCGHIPFCNACSDKVHMGSLCPMCGKQIRHIHRIDFHRPTAEEAAGGELPSETPLT